VSRADSILKGAVYGLSWPPLGLARAVGRGLGSLSFALDKRHREIVLNNLTASFPDKDQAWVAKTAKACFAHLAQVAAEIPQIVRLSPQAISERARFHGLDNFYEAREQGRGVIGLTGHLGNWEWANVAVVHETGARASAVVRPIDWKPADRLVTGWRTKSGAEVVPKSRSARALLKALKEGKLLGLLLDQNVDWYDGEWVNFFGRPACTNKGLALLARHTEAPVVSFYNRRADDGMFDVYFGPEIPLVKTGDKTKDIWDNTQNYTKVLEDIIRQKPEQWFWMHQRWKTKPYRYWPRELN
jgi:Kdo2-lipid IVA lauroyltransferase/acyltransferase